MCADCRYELHRRRRAAVRACEAARRSGDRESLRDALEAVYRLSDALCDLSDEECICSDL